MTRVLVTGVRGKTGLPLAGLLVQRDVEVLGGSSDPSRVDLPGVTPVAFSWDDPAGWPAALAGVDAVFVVRPDRPDAPDLIGALAEHTAPSTRVVLLSDVDADHVDGLDGWAARGEATVRGSGRAWTVLRPNWFAQVFTDARFFRDDLADGVLPYPGGGAAVAWIDARDIAAVAAEALLGDGHDGRTYELTGPQALTLPETAEVLSSVLGHPVEHREVSIEEAVAGTTGFEHDLSVLTFERLAGGRFGAPTDDVEQVTGRPPRPLSALGDD